MYLARLKRYQPTLNFYVTLTEDLALQQAAEADREIKAGKYRGPLHGLPWGAKDLLATKGIRTTFGGEPYVDQVIDYDATVVERLRNAGAVLVAKLTLGALAQGDRWFGGRTNNPWNPAAGSSGSSAGPGSATASGCVAFSIGTETRGSILSPSGVNGVVACGRPTDA
jgi:Asp-tRNA(Asn)/Glu-tRNA(Gln) amidotransferase A subunit family amidase